MAAGLMVKLNLLEEEEFKEAEEGEYYVQPNGELKKARPAKQIGKIKRKTRESQFLEVYRLSEDLVNELESDLSPYMRHTKRASGFTKRFKILYALSFLANGSYQKIVGDNVKRFVSQPSASRAIHEVVDVLNNRNIVSKYMKFPQNEDERRVLQTRFYEKFKIPGVLGCLGGTMVSMIRPRKNDERYLCQKGHYTRSILIISDADQNILHVDVTFGGSVSDSYIFANTRVKAQLEDLNNNGESVHVLGDSGYPQEPYLMTPFSNPEADSPESYYNELHSTAWSTVGKTIQALKGRFRCLLLNNLLHYDPMMVGKLVIACCVLHNLCNRAGLASPGIDIHDLDDETRLLAKLKKEAETHDATESGQTCRQDVVNEIWKEHQEIETCYQDALTIIS